MAYHVETPEGLRLRFELAGPGSRTLAGFLDMLVFFAALALVYLLLLLVAGEWSVRVLGAGVLLGLSGYQVAFGALWNGQTLGKRVFGIRVVDRRGFPATLRQHVLRSLLFPLEALVLSVPLPLGVVVMAVTDHRQRLGDLLAGTLVLRETSARPAPEPLARERWSTLPEQRHGLTPALAARFRRADLEGLRELLGRTDLELEAKKRLQRVAARVYLRRLGRDADEPLPRAEVRSFLKELFLFLREFRSRLR